MKVSELTTYLILKCNPDDDIIVEVSGTIQEAIKIEGDQGDYDETAIIDLKRRDCELKEITSNKHAKIVTLKVEVKDEI